jgi:CRP/FNR family cyclic AMP-dependent transcriptional regulator
VLPALWRCRADLERAAIFGRASVTVKNALARHAVRRRLQPGETLIREGSASTTVFVLVEGRAQVYRGSEPLLVNGVPVILDPGSVLGEAAPFLRQPRNASIVTLDDCEVLAIRGADFERIVRASPQLHHGIAQVVRQRQAA